MWQTDFQPTHSFEQAAQVMGLSRARDLWAHYDLMYKRRAQEVSALEQIMARNRAKKQYIVNETIEGEPEWRMHHWSYINVYRASLNEKGCTGGEFFDDTHFMRSFLKKNPELRITAGSGKIMEGWTPASENSPYARLQAAADEAMNEEVRGIQRMEQAAAQGTYERQLAEDQRGGVAIAG